MTKLENLQVRKNDLDNAFSSDRISTEAARSDLIEILEVFKIDITSDLNIFLELGDLPGLSEEFARDQCSEFLHQLAITFYNRFPIINR